MESAGLRRREHAAQGLIPMETFAPYPTDLEPPNYTIDLSLPPEQRYKRVAIDYKLQLAGLPSLFDEIVHDLHPNIPISIIRGAAKLLLKRLYSAEETAELRGISQVTGVRMYLLVAFNVLLDLFMGCTSGGVRVKDVSGNMKMLHFRTLDWGMGVLRKIIVRLDFIDHAGGSIIASSVTYVGFVGVLTGVRKHLSLSLNFRPAHDASTRLVNFRFYFHQVLVLLGLRPSISTVLRNCLLPPHTSRTGSQFPTTLEAIEHRLPSVATTAAFLIFSNGRRTVTMEKDHRTAIVSSSESFVVALNHDVEDEAPSSSQTGKSKKDRIVLETTGMSDLVSSSINRKQCITKLWHDATARPFIIPTEVYEWMDVYDITNEETHFAMVMDPEAGKILWIKHYLDPIDIDVETLWATYMFMIRNCIEWLNLDAILLTKLSQVFITVYLGTVLQGLLRAKYRGSSCQQSMSSLESSTTSNNSPQRVIKHQRPRRNITSLLGLNYQPPKEDIPFPKVEEDFVKYDGFHLRDCLRFAEQRLRHRMVIPYTQKLLRLYKFTSVEALTTEDRVNRREAIFYLRYYARLIDSQLWLHGQFPRLEPLILQLLAFRELQYRNRYSGFLQAKETEFRYFFESDSKIGYEGLPAHRYWFEMAMSLLEEMNISKEWNCKVKRIDSQGSTTPYHDKIDTACFALGFDSVAMQSAIIEYALDREAFKTDIMAHIARCRWTMLGNLLDHDIKELKCWIPRGRKNDYRRVLAAIEGIKDEWLDKAGSHGVSENWWPNEKARKHMQKYNEAQAAKAVETQDVRN